MFRYNPFDNAGDKALRRHLLSCTTSKAALESHGWLGTKRGRMAWSRMKELLSVEIASMNYAQTEAHLHELLGEHPSHHMYQSVIDQALHQKAQEASLSDAIRQASTLEELDGLKRRYYHVSYRGYGRMFDERRHLLKFA
jgi:hypothetical protein